MKFKVSYYDYDTDKHITKDCDRMVEDKPVVLYGFWQFAEWLIKNGMLRC